METVAAIDPGAKGAICVLIPKHKPLFFDLKKDPRQIVADVDQMYMPHVWVMEKVSANSHDGVTSAHSFGKHVGRIEGKLHGEEIFYAPIRDWQQWAGVWGCGKNTKKKAFEIVSTMYGPEMFKGKRGGIKDGRCDACLIAHWYIENILKKS